MGFPTAHTPSRWKEKKKRQKKSWILYQMYPCYPHAAVAMVHETLLQHSLAIMFSSDG